MIVITADSGISPIKRNNDLIIPACLNGNNIYKDGELTNREILEKIKSGEMIKTSSPDLGSYISTFEDQLKKGNEIIHLSMSSGISRGSYELSNFIAREIYNLIAGQTVGTGICDSISVIDTYQGATGGTLINEIANDLLNKNLSRSEIVDKLNEIKKRIITSFLVPDPSGFIRSGRDKSHLTKKESLRLIGVAMKIVRGYKFIVNFDNSGILYNDGNFKSKDDMFKYVLDRYLNKVTDYESDYIVIGSVLEDKVSMSQTKEYIESVGYFKNIIVKEFPGVVAAYGCPDLCGVSLVKKMI